MWWLSDAHLLFPAFPHSSHRKEQIIPNLDRKIMTSLKDFLNVHEEKVSTLLYNSEKLLKGQENQKKAQWCGAIMLSLEWVMNDLWWCSNWNKNNYGRI